MLTWPAFKFALVTLSCGPKQKFFGAGLHKALTLSISLRVISYLYCEMN